MTTQLVRSPHVYVRDAAITIIPELTEPQFGRLAMFVEAHHPHSSVTRLSYSTALVQNVVIEAGTADEADASMWQLMHLETRAALYLDSDHDSQITSIDVRGR